MNGLQTNERVMDNGAPMGTIAGHKQYNEWKK